MDLSPLYAFEMDDTQSRMYPDIGIIGLVPDEWGDPWMPRQHILTRLAKYFSVVWHDPATPWRTCLASRRPISRNHEDDVDLYGGFAVYRPGCRVPMLHRPHYLATWLTKQRLRGARRVLERMGAKTIVLYVWRPEFANALDLLPHDLCCYHIDDEYTFSEVEQPISGNELRLLREAGQVFIHSPALLEKKGYINAQTLFVPNGVDWPTFARSQTEPADIARIPRPRIGYVGIIKKQLDLALYLRLAESHPHWSFVFVGPEGVIGQKAELLGRLLKLPNVHSLGRKNLSELSSYMQHMDVCTMGYEDNEYTKYIFPLKVNEYLAAGRPVVATPIRSLAEFSDVIEMAVTPTDWEDAIARSLAAHAQSDSATEQRRTVAKRYDWDRLAALIARAICERLGRDFPLTTPIRVLPDEGAGPSLTIDQSATNYRSVG